MNQSRAKGTKEFWGAAQVVGGLNEERQELSLTASLELYYPAPLTGGRCDAQTIFWLQSRTSVHDERMGRVAADKAMSLSHTPLRRPLLRVEP